LDINISNKLNSIEGKLSKLKKKFDENLQSTKKIKFEYYPVVKPSASKFIKDAYGKYLIIGGIKPSFFLISMLFFYYFGTTFFLEKLSKVSGVFALQDWRAWFEAILQNPIPFVITLAVQFFIALLLIRGYSKKQIRNIEKFDSDSLAVINKAFLNESPLVQAETMDFYWKLGFCICLFFSLLVMSRISAGYIHEYPANINKRDVIRYGGAVIGLFESEKKNNELYSYNQFEKGLTKEEAERILNTPTDEDDSSETSNVSQHSIYILNREVLTKMLSSLKRDIYVTPNKEIVSIWLPIFEKNEPKEKNSIKYELSDADKELVGQTIAGFAKKINTTCDVKTKFEVIGYADSNCFKTEGDSCSATSDNDNIKLANRRASAVIRFLNAESAGMSLDLESIDIKQRHWVKEQYDVMRERALVNDVSGKSSEEAIGNWFSRRVEIRISEPDDC